MRWGRWSFELIPEILTFLGYPLSFAVFLISPFGSFLSFSIDFEFLDCMTHGLHVVVLVFEPLSQYARQLYSNEVVISFVFLN